MTQADSVTAEELVRALKRRKAALPAEIGSFVVLEACESLLLAGPRLLTTAEVSIFVPQFKYLRPFLPRKSSALKSFNSPPSFAP